MRTTRTCRTDPPRQQDLQLRTKEKEKKEEDANKCAVCGKDVRFFCDCRDGDQDFERLLPDGGKVEAGHRQLRRWQAHGGARQRAQVRPPSPPRPYQGRPTPKYGVDGRGRGRGVGASAPPHKQARRSTVADRAAAAHASMCMNS